MRPTGIFSIEGRLFILCRLLQLLKTSDHCCSFDVCAAPHVPDPFQTLADIYDAKGDTDKRMQVCFLIIVL